MTTPLNVGLLGAGRIGKVHAEAIMSQVPEARISRIVDVVEAAASGLGTRYNIPYSTDPSEIFEDDSIEAVLICSSTDTHAEYMVAAAKAGKHIFCEKPIDLTLARVDEALAAVDSAGVKLMIGFNRRFDANFAKLQEVIQSGGIGTEEMIRITSRDPGPPPIEYIKVSGGLFMDMMIHDFDIARFMFGEIEEVTTLGSVMVDPAIGDAGDVDTAIVTLKFTSGAIGAIDNSRRAVYGYDQRVEAFGSKGMADIKNNFPNTHTIYNANGITSEKPLYFFLERYMEAYGNEMKAFIDCIVNDYPSPANGLDGRMAIVAAMAAKKSMVERRPVPLSEIG